MKKKQLIKKVRDVPEDVVRLHLEYRGRTVTDYFLVGSSGVYERGAWGQNGRPSLFLFFSDDEVLDFAIEQYLLSHCQAYELFSEVPDRADATAEGIHEV